ncbi:MAG: hypothetical protein F6K31_38845, partial [Symploca sp. SIO2G7]|nr:hypothetical protein [Symploca sp. SIO2G7]
MSALKATIWSAAMEIKAQEYKVTYEPAISTVRFKGELALMSIDDYPPIATLLDRSLEAAMGRSQEVTRIGMSL